MKKVLIPLALFVGVSVSAEAAIQTFSASDTGGSTRSKLNSNFSELDTTKESKAVVQASAPADTNIDWYDTDQESGVLILKRHNGTTWVRASSHGVQYATSCVGITGGMCVDTDDGKLYYHNGTTVVEVGTGDGSIPTASAETLGGVKIGSRLTITDGVLSADVQSGGFDPSADIDFTGDIDFSGATVTGISGTVPTCTNDQDVTEWDSTTSAWVCVTPVEITAGTGITLTSGVVSVTANTFQPLDADLTTAAGASAASSSTYFGKNSSGTVGFHAIPSGGGSAIADLTDWPSGLTATELDYVNGATSNLQSQINAISAGSGGVTTVVTSDPYSDVACTGSKYNSANDRFFPCLGGYHVGYIGLTDFSNPTPDLTPDAFSFTDITAAELSTQYTALAQVTGITGGIVCSGSGGTVASCTGSTEDTCGTFGATSGSIANNQYVGIRQTSSASNSTATNAIATCGGVSDIFIVTTADAVADSGSFTGTDNTTLSAYNSNWAAADGGSIANAILKSNQLYQNSSTPFWAMYTASTSDISQVVVKAQAQSTTAVLKGPLVRASADTTGYYLLMQTVSSGNYTGVLFLRDGVSVGSCVSVITASLTADHTLKIVASGTNPTTLQGYVDGSLVCTKTDSTTPATSGSPGIYMGNIVNTGDRYVDDWSDQ